MWPELNRLFRAMDAELQPLSFPVHYGRPPFRGLICVSPSTPHMLKIFGWAAITPASGTLSRLLPAPKGSRFQVSTGKPVAIRVAQRTSPSSERQISSAKPSISFA